MPGKPPFENLDRVSKRQRAAPVAQASHLAPDQYKRARHAAGTRDRREAQVQIEILSGRKRLIETIDLL